jgi:hypothetical protein
MIAFNIGQLIILLAIGCDWGNREEGRGKKREGRREKG